MKFATALVGSVLFVAYILGQALSDWFSNILTSHLH